MKFCSFCGNQLPARNIKFCPKCGKNIKVQTEVQPRTTPILPTPVKEELRHPRMVSEPKFQKIQPQKQISRQPQKTDQQAIQNKPKLSEIEITSDQRLVLFNQRIKASLERLIDSNNNLRRRESYQLADYSNVTLKLNEILTYQKESLFEKSDFVEATDEVLDESYTVLMRISEFLTSHLSTYGLEKIRAKWYALKEKQNHLKLDRDRLLNLNKISKIMEQNIRIITYRLDKLNSLRVERSIFFAAYPQIHHYYFKELDKTIPHYIKQIHEAGYYRYYTNELKVLQDIQLYFTGTEDNSVDPHEIYLSCTEYLERRNRIAKKIESILIEAQRQIITNQDIFQELRIRYIGIMEEVIGNAPNDVLLMTNFEEIRSEQKEKDNFQLDSMEYDDGLNVVSGVEKLSYLGELSSLSELDSTKNLDRLDTLSDTSKLGKFPTSPNNFPSA